MKDPSADATSPVEETGPPPFDAEEIERLLRRHFKVYEVEHDFRGWGMADIAAFYVQIDSATFNERFEALREAVRKKDPTLVVLLQHKLGEDIVIVARKPPVREKGAGLNVFLLLLTIVTTTLAGSIFYQGYDQAENLLNLGSFDASFLHPRLLALGFLTFSFPLILILGVHELGHYFVARRHRVRTSLPYFIPVPPIVPIGTFGAFISMREPIPDRKALFDIGASGPIVGFLLAVPVVLVGMFLTAFFAVPVPPSDEIHLRLEPPDSNGIVYGYGAPMDSAHGSYSTEESREGNQRVRIEQIQLNLTTAYPDGLPNGTWRVHVTPLYLRDSQRVDVAILLPNATPMAGIGEFVLEDDQLVARARLDVFDAPASSLYFFSLPANATEIEVQFRWELPSSGLMRFGDSLLFLGLQYVVDLVFPVEENVFLHPTGIAGWVGLLVTGFNLLPAGQLDGGHVARAILGDRMKWASYASIFLMFVLSFWFSGWLLMAILVVFLGLQHPPPLNDRSPLDTKRRVVATVILILFVVTFVPIPLVEV